MHEVLQLNLSASVECSAPKAKAKEVMRLQQLALDHLRTTVCIYIHHQLVPKCAASGSENFIYAQFMAYLGYYTRMAYCSGPVYYHAAYTDR